MVFMAKKQFDLIVFDWDGTLMDSTAAIASSIQKAARDLGQPVPSTERAAWVIGLGLGEALQTLVPNMAPGMYVKMIERYRYHYLTQGDQTTLFPGVREMLQDLQEKAYFLAVATGKSRVGLNRAMANAGLVSLFHTTRCADETFSKPHPAMLQEITRELGQDLRRTLMIGDTTHDLQMAKNAGAAAVAVQYGAHPVATLMECEPMFCAQDIASLHAWLTEHA